VLLLSGFVAGVLSPTFGLFPDRGRPVARRAAPAGWSGATSVWPVRAAMLGELVVLASFGGRGSATNVLVADRCY
jgi:hypothetical protein